MTPTPPLEFKEAKADEILFIQDVGVGQKTFVLAVMNISGGEWEVLILIFLSTHNSTMTHLLIVHNLTKDIS